MVKPHLKLTTDSLLYKRVFGRWVNVGLYPGQRGEALPLYERHVILRARWDAV